MDTLTQYRESVRRVILEHAGYTPSHGAIEAEVVITPAGDHFELIRIGWDGPRRVHATVIHIDIIGDKIWVQHDGTSPGVAEELAEAGIPREAIVLGFRPQQVRRYSGFGVT